MVERIHAGDFDSKVLADGTFALVDFYSDSCVPCKTGAGRVRRKLCR